MKTIFNLIFGFGKRYRQKELAYARDSRRFGTSWALISVIILSAVPIACLWGAFFVSEPIWRVFCIIGCLTILYFPKELMITGIVALRHRTKMKIQSRVEGELIEGFAESITGENADGYGESYKARGTASGYDLAVGIIAILFSVLVIVAFVLCFFWLFEHFVILLQQ